MVHIPPNPVDQKTLLAAVRSAVRAAGGRPVSLRKFLAASGMREWDIFRHYSKWDEVLRAAGFHFAPSNKKIEPARLFDDWARVARKLRRLPSRREYQIHGQYDPTVLARRFGSWRKVRDAFRAFAARKSQWADILALLPPPCPARAMSPRRAPRPPGRPLSRPAPRLNGRPVYGAPLDFGALRRAPVNESGVSFLFALLAERLGFQVEALQTSFPDCEAKRLLDSGLWQTVRIEFEYESRNFRDHGHDPAACDLIVCWIHNWPDCPGNLEVISLSDELKRLASHGKIPCLDPA